MKRYERLEEHDAFLTMVSRYSNRLDGRGSIPGRSKISSLHGVQTGSRALLPSDSAGTDGSFPESKASGA